VVEEINFLQSGYVVRPKVLKAKPLNVREPVRSPTAVKPTVIHERDPLHFGEGGTDVHQPGALRRYEPRKLFPPAVDRIEPSVEIGDQHHLPLSLRALSKKGEEWRPQQFRTSQADDVLGQAEPLEKVATAPRQLVPAVGGTFVEQLSKGPVNRVCCFAADISESLELPPSSILWRAGWCPIRDGPPVHHPCAISANERHDGFPRETALVAVEQPGDPFFLNAEV
jgi:hypothetical protein